MELHQRRHSRAAGAPALLQFEWLSKTRGAQAFVGAAPEGLAGMAELGPLFPGWPGGAKPLLLRASFLVSPAIAAYKRRKARPGRKRAVPGTSWRSWFEPSPLDYLGPTRRKRGLDQRKTYQPPAAKTMTRA